MSGGARDGKRRHLDVAHTVPVLYCAVQRCDDMRWGGLGSCHHARACHMFWIKNCGQRILTLLWTYFWLLLYGIYTYTYIHTDVLYVGKTMLLAPRVADFNSIFFG